MENKGPEPFVGKPLEVRVDERGLDRALRRLRRITASEGILREMKRRRHYEKRARRPSASCAKPPAAGSAA